MNKHVSYDCYFETYQIFTGFFKIYLAEQVSFDQYTMFSIHHSVCELGYYGLGCNQECSPFCLRSRDCHHVSGYCKEGCKNGWQGLQCLEGLFHSKFKVLKCIINHAEKWENVKRLAQPCLRACRIENAVIFFNINKTICL